MLQNEKKNQPKYPKNLKNGVYFDLVQRYIGHFQWFQGYFAYFLGFSGILVILKDFEGIVVILGAFWSFSRVLGNFGHPWCILVLLAVLRGSFQGFCCIYRIFGNLEILASKIKFCFGRENNLEMPRMATYSQNHQNYQNTP